MADRAGAPSAEDAKTLIVQQIKMALDLEKTSDGWATYVASPWG